jgi:hypothetical protein
VFIGSTPLSGINLRVNKILTGAVDSYGIRSEGQIQSDVTNSARYFYTNPSVQNTAFTLSTLYHYHSDGGSSFGSATVQIQYGFAVSSQLTGGSILNAAFRGGIASASGRWNLYMDGTASNYLNGVLTIGTTSPNASAKVQIDTTTQGFLPPRMTTTQKNAIATPAAGLVIFDTTLSKLCVYSGAAWQTITSV